MDELTRYVVTYYPELMTVKERAAYKALVAEKKAENAGPGSLQDMILKKWGTKDPDVLALLENGPEEFLHNVRGRILREHPDQVFLNYCPKCGALTNTPKAKQCPKCFFSWHEQ